MLKAIFLFTSMAVLTVPSLTETYPLKTPLQLPLYYQRYQLENKHDEYTGTLILAALLGSASGLLCREFEKKILLDIFPLRIANILIWGIAQERSLQTIIKDAHKNQENTHQELIKKIAWLCSWITYLLGD